MTDRELRQRVLEIAKMAEAYGKKLSQAQARVMVHLTSDIPLEELGGVVDVAVRQSRWLPTVDQLLEVWRTGGRGYQLAAEASWARVDKALHHASGQQRLQEAERRAISRIGGWDYLRSLPLAQLRLWARKEYCRSYQDQLMRDEERLPLLSDQDREELGLPRLGEALRITTTEKED